MTRTPREETEIETLTDEELRKETNMRARIGTMIEGMLTVIEIEKMLTVKEIEKDVIVSMAKAAADPGQEKKERNRKSREKEVLPIVIHTILTIPSVLMTLQSLLLSWS